MDTGSKIVQGMESLESKGVKIGSKMSSCLRLLESELLIGPRVASWVFCHGGSFLLVGACLTCWVKEFRMLNLLVYGVTIFEEFKEN